MDKYYGFVKEVGESTRITVNVSGGFSEVEMIGALATIKEAEKDPIWGLGVGGSIASYPTLHEGVLYFGACDKNFYAVDAETGEEVWRFETKGPFDIILIHDHEADTIHQAEPIVSQIQP